MGAWQEQGRSLCKLSFAEEGYSGQGRDRKEKKMTSRASNDDAGQPSQRFPRTPTNCHLSRSNKTLGVPILFSLLFVLVVVVPILPRDTGADRRTRMDSGESRGSSWQLLKGRKNIVRSVCSAPFWGWAGLGFSLLPTPFFFFGTRRRQCFQHIARCWPFLFAGRQQDSAMFSFSACCVYVSVYIRTIKIDLWRTRGGGGAKGTCRRAALIGTTRLDRAVITTSICY